MPHKMIVITSSRKVLLDAEVFNIYLGRTCFCICY